MGHVANVRKQPASLRSDSGPHHRNHWPTSPEYAASEIINSASHRRDDGLFHDVVDQASTFVETNLAQMLAYAIYSGVAEGWLPTAYREPADTLRAAARARLDSSGYVRGLCSAPNFDRPGVSTEGQAFCVLMEAAGSRLELADPVVA